MRKLLKVNDLFTFLGANDYRTVIEIDLSHDGQVLWIQTLCGKYVDMKVEPIAIDLSPAHEVDRKSHKTTKEVVKNPQTALVNAKLAPYDTVDLIKVNAGVWTPYILETLKEVIDVNKPFMFIELDDRTDSDTIHTLLIEEFGYHSPEVTINQKAITLVYHHDDASVLEEFN